MGRGIVESGLFRSERYQYELRTSDPATTKEGEMWIRTDLAPNTDQLATLRFDAGGSTWDIPIYDVAADTADVIDVWRVPIGGTTGFIPLTTDSPAFDPLRFQHGGTVYGVHDSLKTSQIPQSGLLHSWPTDAGSGATLVDSENNADFSFNQTSNWISGVGYNDWVVETDGTDDIGTAAQSDLLDWGDQGALLFVIKTSSWSTDGILFYHQGNDQRLYIWDTSSLQIGLGSSGKAFTATHPPASTWIGIAVSWDTGAADLYYYDLEANSLHDSFSSTYGGTMKKNDSLEMAGQSGQDRYKAAKWDVPLLYGEFKTQTDITNWFSDIAGYYP